MSARGSNGGSHTDEEWRAQLRRQFYRCNNPFCMCDLRADGVVVHRDHLIPVTSGGTDDISNIRAMCAPCNLRKGAKSWRVFLAEERRAGRPPRWRLWTILLFTLGMVKGLIILPLGIVVLGCLCLALFGVGWISRLLNGVLGGFGLLWLLTWAWRGPRVERVGVVLGALAMIVLMTPEDTLVRDTGFGMHPRPRLEAGPIAIPRAAALPRIVPYPPKRPRYLDQPFG